MKLVVTGGGTGGHIFSGVAIAQEFLSQSKANEVLFIGSDQGLETRLVPKAGLELRTLSLGKLKGQSAIQKIITLIQIPFAILKCMWILKKFGADMVVGVGGFAAGPCIVAAKILGLHTAVLEQNSVMGFTNRVAARFSDFIFLTFNQLPKNLPASKCVVSGNPIRASLKPYSGKDKNAFVLFAFGGSQGATGINKMMCEAAALLKDHGIAPKIIHQTGEKDFDWVKKTYQNAGIPAEVYPFIDNMQGMYDQASVVVCRSGSGTISELAATENVPVFVPFPFAADNHQEVNARQVEQAGGGFVLVQGKNTGQDLADILTRLQKNPTELEQKRKMIKNFYRPDAAKRIIDTLKSKVYVQKN